ncbi:MAG: single-stranded-DNA-specific exonuclease RecJ [Rhodocyclaceae bacterium]|nr:single-stranded-DNA-specific exonuclease RecJ [Rhodocyclaceae bacterium]
MHSLTSPAVRLKERPAPTRTAWQLEQAGVAPLLARLYAARGVRSADELDSRLGALLPPDTLKGMDVAAALLADHISASKRLLIVADYDCDGATACAVAWRGLRLLGVPADRLAYFVPDRFTQGYGLSPEVSRCAATSASYGVPDLLITVDNGIASVEGVAEATRLGMQTLITDHHLPGDHLPAAAAIVNPNQPGCRFGSKALAGVGVMFYLLLATRAELRRRGTYQTGQEPNLATLLDLVTLGTVADVVPLDRNNRILVTQGLARMRMGKMQPGIAALFRIAGREPARAACFDLGFALGPRLNAAGRLANMSLGIECLITDDPGRALNIAQELDATNIKRREIESDMRESAEMLLADIDAEDRSSLTLFDPDWHQGVVGILAGRVKEQTHRPTFALARNVPEDGKLKGSGRSIPGLHLRDALDLVSKRNPDLLLRFGGHAAAAGLTILEDRLTDFEQAFESVCDELLPADARQRTLDTDGPLESGFFSLDNARRLQQEVWGQAFPAPLFCDEFSVRKQRILKDKHLKLVLEKSGQTHDAICFNYAGTVTDRVRAAYTLDINEWQGVETVQLRIAHIENLG